MKGIPIERKFMKLALDSTQRPSSPAAMRRSGIAVGCSALSGFVVMFHSYDYFSSGVSFFKIPDSISNLT